MTYSLNTIILEPLSKNKPKNAVILCHGYGGDGKDISSLSLNWKRYLPNTVFICPNGHERCAINPTGYQWFDLTNEDKDYILQESKKCEIKLQRFVEEIKHKFNLKNDKICLSKKTKRHR